MSRRSRKRREGLHLTDKRHPKRGIWSMLLGILSIIFFMVVCIMSGLKGGTMGIEAGVLGFCCVFVSLAGFLLGWFTLRIDNIRQLFPSIGIVINGLMILLYLIVYILGT